MGPGVLKLHVSTLFLADLSSPFLKMLKLFSALYFLEWLGWLESLEAGCEWSCECWGRCGEHQGTRRWVGRKWLREEPEKIDHLYNFAVEAPTLMGKNPKCILSVCRSQEDNIGTQGRNQRKDSRVDGSDWIWTPKTESPCRVCNEPLYLRLYSFSCLTPVTLRNICEYQRKEKIKIKQDPMVFSQVQNPSVCPFLVGKKKKKRRLYLIS